MTQRIHLISSPRNLSTAMMYSFGNRTDTSVTDEPYYGLYLSKSGIKHPDGHLVIASQEKTETEVLEKAISQPVGTSYYFIKNMAKHFKFIEDWSFMLDLKNIIYLRDPAQIISSFTKVVDNPTMQELGFVQLEKIYDYLISNGKSPIVLDSKELLSDPEGVLRWLCSKLDMPFDPAMLNWKAGPKPYDGVWAPHWYGNVHRSTKFIMQKSSQATLSKSFEGLCKEATQIYEKLTRRIT